MAFEKVSGDIAGDLQRLVNVIGENINRLQTVAANEAGSRIERRIFTEGQSAGSGDIGQYSTRAAYFSEDAFVKKSAFRPRGKTNTKRANRKTMYLNRGYSELRGIQGRRNDKVDLNYRGDLQRGIQTGQSGSDVAYGFISPLQRQIAQYNEDRFGKKIFEATQDEIQAAERKYLQELDIVVRGAFR